MKFSVQHATDQGFVKDGLRPYFEYRDLNIKNATDGKAIMHVIRAREGTHTTGDWHYHEVDFQVTYILKGWAIFEYEGQGEHKLVAGTCVHQPPGIKHREIAHSDDLELIEIVMPGDFKTISLDK